MAEVIWTEPALAQLETILEFVALDKPDAARKVAEEVFKRTGKLEDFVRLGRPIPEFRHTRYRQVWVRPCWLYYRIAEDSVVILHVRRAERPLVVDDLLEEE